MDWPPTLGHAAPLVARAVPFAALQEALDAARAGRGRCLLLTGDAGIGKSRLARDFAAQAAADVLLGQANPGDQDLPFAPLVDALRRRLVAASPAEARDLLGPDASALIKLLPDLELRLPDVKPPPLLGPELEKRRLFEALFRLFSRLASPTPLLLLVDDIHWADEASLDFLYLLARRLPDQPMMLLLTARAPDRTDATPARFLSRLLGHRLATELRLPPLSREAVDALLRAIFAWDQPVRRPLLDAIYALTEGNPFFVEEVARTLVATGDIAPDPRGRWRARDLDQLPIPHSLRLLVQQRTAGLSPAALDLLALVAVARFQADFPLLAAVSGHDETSLLELLKELVAAGLLQEVADDEFAFRHALTREAIVDGLLSRERRRWHRAIATHLEARPGAAEHHLPQLAHHLYEAGAWEGALTANLAAADQAERRFAPHTVLQHLARAATAAAALNRELPAGARRQRGLALQTIGEFDAARAAFEDLGAAARAAGDRRAEWRALHDLGFLWLARDYARTGDYLQEALALARSLDDPAALGQSLNRMGNWLANLGRPGDALSHHQEALSLFMEKGDARGLAATHDLIATAYGIAGNVAASDRHYHEALPLFRRLGDRKGEASTLMMLTLGRDTPAGEQALDIAREIGWRDGEAYAHIRLALAHVSGGDFGLGLAHARQGLTIAGEIDHGPWQAAGLQAIGLAHFFMLEPADAEAALLDARRLAAASGAQVWLDAMNGLAALARLDQDDPGGAADLLADYPTPPDGLEALGRRYVALAQGELALVRGHPEAALAIVAAVLEATPELAAWRDRAWPLLRQLEGRALAAAGHEDQALTVLADAARLGDAYGLTPLTWRCRAERARLFLAGRRRDEAAAELTEASRQIAALADTIPDDERAARFRQAAEALCPTLPPLTTLQRRKQAHDGLTRRERQVAALVARGMTNQEIADELFITLRTAKTHVGNILNKLDYSSRAQIAVWAADKGLLD